MRYDGTCTSKVQLFLRKNFLCCSQDVKVWRHFAPGVGFTKEERSFKDTPDSWIFRPVFERVCGLRRYLKRPEKLMWPLCKSKQLSLYIKLNNGGCFGLTAWSSRRLVLVPSFLAAGKYLLSLYYYRSVKLGSWLAGVTDLSLRMCVFHSGTARGV